MSKVNDKSELLEAVKKNGLALQYASDALKDRVVLEAVKTNPYALQYGSDALKNNKEIVLEAVKNPFVLQYASEDLKNDEDVVLEAVKKNPRALQYSSYLLKHNTKILNHVTSQGITRTYILEHFMKEHQSIKDKWLLWCEMMKNTLDVYRSQYHYEYPQREFSYFTFPDNIKKSLSDQYFVLYAIKHLNHDRILMSGASPAIRGIKEIVLEAVKNDGLALQYASLEIRGIKEIVLEAVKNKGHALQYASEDLQNDEEVISQAYNTSGRRVFKFLSNELRKSVFVRQLRGHQGNINIDKALFEQQHT